MKTYKIKTRTIKLLADIITPVSIYLKLRDRFVNSILLESSDYHSNENSFSFICLQPIASFKVENNCILKSFPDGQDAKTAIDKQVNVPEELNKFVKMFEVEPNQDMKVNGLFGFTSYNAIQYFENIELASQVKNEQKIPEMIYSLYKYIIAINHFKNELVILENNVNDDQSELEHIVELLNNRNFAAFHFETLENESSPVSNEAYLELVKKGKEHCHRGDVFQIVLSRPFEQKFKGDEFNVYRALRSVNPSPYLFYFDYGSFKLFGSSPEAQIVINADRAIINPIAGTFRRTGDDEADKLLAEKLSKDPKENAEHVMLVDLARNDLSRNSDDVKVETYREVQYYSHVIHLVSKVSGKLEPNTNIIKVFADTFPAGTLSGAPKHMAMQLIDKYESQRRGYYGGGIGYIGFNNELNHAIIIRSFLSKDNTLFYQAGAGIVSESNEESELNEVNNKLMALKKAIELAQTI